MATEGELQISDVSKLKVAELKRELKARGLSAVGVKNELVERLLTVFHTTALDEDEDVLEDDVLADDGKASDDVSFQDEIILNSPTATESPSKIGVVSEKIDTDKSIDLQQEDSTNNNNSPEDEKVIINKLQGLSDDEKKALRAKKFDLPMSDDLRKQARAERFGISETAKTGNATVTNLQAADRLKLRAERFGLEKVDDKFKLKARADRFGATAVKSQSTDNAALKKRKEKFGTVSENEDLEAKKKKRAARFGLS